MDSKFSMYRSMCLKLCFGKIEEKFPFHLAHSEVTQRPTQKWRKKTGMISSLHFLNILSSLLLCRFKSSVWHSGLLIFEIVSIYCLDLAYFE